ncbi:AAA family ATPase [Pseudomonas sp. ODNR1LW]|nr:AAA family ATPase [Pseudomonas sp. ODNR1LW]
MITQVDIGSFGSFTGLNWKKTIKDSGQTVQNFKRLNIIYGRNYSGKTTLSRIFRALETGKLPLNYASPSFTIYGEKGEITETGVATKTYDVRVYNKDFVTDNLNFLIDQSEGEIKTFAIVGEKNKEIDDEITDIETMLGEADKKTGLRYDLILKQSELKKALSDHKNAGGLLEDKLRAHANDKIKKNREYGAAVYNIESIRKDIASTKKDDFTRLSSEDQIMKLALLKQAALPNIDETVEVKLRINEIRKTAEPLLSLEITPTKPIQELLNDSILQLWVKQGIPLHKNKRDTCAFCHQALPHDIWQILDSHFSKESADLESAIDDCLISVNSEIKSVSDFTTLKGDIFYAEERVAFEVSSVALAEALIVYKKDLTSLKMSLEARSNNLFKPVILPALMYDSHSIQSHLDTINDLIAKSNSKSQTLETDKNAARVSLRLSDVAAFVQAIDYDNELTRISDLKSISDAASTTLADAQSTITELEEKISTLRSTQKDERKGADRVSTILSHFFGHDGIKLEAKDNAEKTAVKFEVTRDGKSAYNLSEGECSLIAFCYFIAKLEEADSKGKELVIYIDDPISSLDGNHIFFMFSLIESLIARPIKNEDGSNSYRYKQLFISTHNLDFLKYLKKLSIPNEKNHGGHQNFLIERNGAASGISLMPSYLKDYITEFNYLFHQIYKCRDQGLAKIDHEPFYAFGNNLRKFLEAYLFYKYPHHDDKNNTLERITKFFGEDDTAVALANRLNNEMSHLESIFDRSVRPVEIPEIPKLASYVLDKIYAADPEQYNALLKSIGEPERQN